MTKFTYIVKILFIVNPTIFSDLTSDCREKLTAQTRRTEVLLNSLPNKQVEFFQ